MNTMSCVTINIVNVIKWNSTEAYYFKRLNFCIFDYVKTIFLFNTSSPCSQSRVFNYFFSRKSQTSIFIRIFLSLVQIPDMMFIVMSYPDHPDKSGIKRSNSVSCIPKYLSTVRDNFSCPVINFKAGLKVIGFLVFHLNVKSCWWQWTIEGKIKCLIWRRIKRLYCHIDP